VAEGSSAERLAKHYGGSIEGAALDSPAAARNEPRSWIVAVSPLDSAARVHGEPSSQSRIRGITAAHLAKVRFFDVAGQQ
jgi:hypothetical protein